jgi:multiple sugar transport system substrate-binding protein
MKRRSTEVTKKWLGRCVITALILLGPWATSVSSQPVRSVATAPGLLMASTQFTPADEATAFRSILASAPVAVNFQPGDAGSLTAQLTAGEQTRHVTISVFGGLHGDFAPFVSQGFLQDLTPLLTTLTKRGFPKNIVKLSTFGRKTKHYYIPWIQATYVLAVNRKALRYLPRGVNVTALTYDQLIQWGRNMLRGTGKRLIGLPAGPTGLIHRFIQGYLYPSFTHSAGVVGFKSAAAATMWQKLKDLWAVTNPDSTGYNFMQEPLLSGDVWVAWDHVARLITAATQKPKDFILVPAPRGPEGLGYLIVIGGLAIPKGAPDVNAAKKLIAYLTGPYAQINTLTSLGFFPVTNARIPSTLPAGIRLEAAAVSRQAHAKHTIPSLLPVGLGTEGTPFNKIYLDTFRRIVLDGEPIRPVLKDEGSQLQAIMDATGAGCWAPDPPSKGPCHVK